MNKTIKIGHQSPIGTRINKFNSVEIKGDLAYCKSHNFVYNNKEDDEKLHNGLPCYYTDIRFTDGTFNFYKNTYLHWTRFKDISLKACIRKVQKCKNIPIGTIVNFKKSWHYTRLKIDNSYKFKIKKKNKFDIKYQVSKPEFSAMFSKCTKSNKLVDLLRKNGFLVEVFTNQSFLKNMINTAVQLRGGTPINSELDGEVAIAYGNGKRIGFSSFSNDFMGYSNGEKNILWDKFDEFNKWSQCYEIPKVKTPKEILKILTT